MCSFIRVVNFSNTVRASCPTLIDLLTTFSTKQKRSPFTGLSKGGNAGPHMPQLVLHCIPQHAIAAHIVIVQE